MKEQLLGLQTYNNIMFQQKKIQKNNVTNTFFLMTGSMSRLISVV